MSLDSVLVKEEVEIEDASCVSAAAARAGLYAGHNLKNELVVGPVRLHQQHIVNFVQARLHRGARGTSETDARAGLYADRYEVQEEGELRPVLLQPIDVTISDRDPLKLEAPEDVNQELLPDVAGGIAEGPRSTSLVRHRGKAPEGCMGDQPGTRGYLTRRRKSKEFKQKARGVPIPDIRQSQNGTSGPVRPRVSRKKPRQPPATVTVIKTAAACDKDEAEGEATVGGDHDRIRKWEGELPPPESSVTSPSCSQPASEVSCDYDYITGTVSVHAVEQPNAGPSSCHAGSQLTVGHADARPSTSGTTEAPRLTTGLVAEGSEFDSDFDDEFDLNEIAANADGTRDIPDDEVLGESVGNIVNRVERAMDDAIERLVSGSTDFEWREDFDSFHGIPETFSGTPGSTKDYETPYEAFTDIWSEDFMEIVVRETNRYAHQVIDAKRAAGSLKETSRLVRWTDTDVDEMYVLFAVYILMGMNPRTSQFDYFKSGGFLEMPKFRELMTYNRFVLLNKFLHFVDNSDASQELSQSDGVLLPAKLRKIAPVLSHLNAKFQSLYGLHRDVAIDESLILYKGRLHWAQAIRSKASRLGIKSYELCEPRTGYMYKFDIYTGENSECDDFAAPSTDLADKSTQAVLDLLQGLESRGHCVTMTNFYNSPALAQHLKRLGFDCLGKLRASRRNVPKEIAEAPNDVPKGTVIALHSGDVSCIAWKDIRMVNMISTYHIPEVFEGESGRALAKPLVVRDYNNIMGAIDLNNQKLTMYLMERKRCLKWYMKIFKRLLNISVHNAFVLLLSSFKRRNMPPILHRDFRERLANALVMAHRPTLPRGVSVVSEVTRLRRDIIHVPKYLSRATRMRCHICKRKGISKLGYLKCVTCDEGLCFEDCWHDWHSLQELPGKSVVHVRKVGRRPK